MTTLEFIQILGAIGEFVGAIAVVVTLIYLSRQVRDSARSAQAAAVESARTRRISSFEAVRDSPYLPPIQVKIARGEELDEEERLRASNHYAALWGLLYAEWIQRDLGTVGEYVTRPEIALTQALSSPGAMQWWNNAGVGLYPPRFIDYIEKMLEEIDLDAASNLIERSGFLAENRSVADQ